MKTAEQTGLACEHDHGRLARHGNLRYPWTRFWCSREGTLRFSDGGFLADPEGKYAKYAKSSVVPFATIADLPCVAMLGEPGIGKSTAIEDVRDAVQESLAGTGDDLVYFNLNEYGDESRLIRGLFASSSFGAWVNGTHKLHLILDSLDECRLRIPQVATIVINHLRQVSVHLPRLRVRIACRTADWPSTFEEGFPELWGKDGYGAFELAPLRRKDVEVAARAEQIDPAAFLAELDRTEAVPLAIKPITLAFLLSAFKARGQLPSSRRELYELGCTMLCEEPSRNRRDQGETGQLSAQERVAIASRIAAVSIFCRKPSVGTGPISAQQVAEDVPVSSLAGGDEPVESHRVAVDDKAVREVLGTGLFSSRGHERMGFAHQTYAEFLAGHYLSAHGLGTQQVLSVLCHPDDPDGLVVPQLYETAAWIAGENNGVLAAIAECDPQVLLRGDGGSLSEQDRRLIVDSLLRALDEHRANDRDWDLTLQYAKLNHCGLADQLRPWIVDKTKHHVARDAAIGIADACQVTEVESVLANLALDQTEPIRLRDSAARAVGSVAGRDTRLRLRPLAFGLGGDDPADQLKGDALRALWPELISTEDLFQCLTPPRQQSFYGAYAGFLDSDLAKNLRAGDLPHAITWLKGLATQDHLGFRMRRLTDQVAVQGWQHMDDPSVLQALAEMSVECFRHYQDLLRDAETMKEHPDLFDDPKLRRRLAARIVAMDQDRDMRLDLIQRRPHLIRVAEDFEWCTEQLRNSVGQVTEAVWADLTWSVFCWAPPDSARLDTLFAARAMSPSLRKESDLFFTPVELDSPRAAKMREQHIGSLDRPEDREPEPLEWLPRDRMAYCLGRSEGGDPHAWCALLGEMTLEDTSTHYGLVPSDIRSLPGWKRADPPTRQRIIAAADRVLRDGSVDTLKWLREPHSWRTSDTAPYAALLLLRNEAPVLYDALPAWTWQRHVATVVCMPFFDMEDGPRRQHEGIAITCYQRARDAVLFYLPLQLDAEDRGGRHISCDRKLGLCWDDGLKETVHRKLVEAQPYWQSRSFDQIGSLLLACGYHPTRELFVTNVQAVTDGICGNMERARISGAGLIEHSPDAAWAIVWPAIMANNAFGRELVMSVAYGLHHDAGGVAAKLTEVQLGDLFVWLVKEFPYSQDRGHNGAYSPTKDDSARELRDGVLRFLEGMGTPASVLALERAADEFPSHDWLRSVVIEARRNALRKTWNPCTPADLLALASRPGTKLVRNARELQELLVEALSALEGKLQGETPAAPDLWDPTVRKGGQAVFRPRDENRLSDWIKRNLEPELKSRGIVAAREPEIRRGEGSGQGERTDILVTALVPGLTDGTWDQARVIIETKGCWNRQLNTAMKDQLVGRYLKGNDCRHGIYLVGWYCCDQWDSTDRRKRSVPRWSLDEARTRLGQQAERLSQGSVSLRSVVINVALR